MPRVPKQTAGSSPSTKASRRSPPTPKPAIRKDPSTAITSRTSFNRLMRLRGTRLLTYLEIPHKHYRRLAAGLCELMQREHADCLHPCNAEARIAFAQIVQRELTRFDIPRLTPLCWVTLSPGRFALPIHEAGAFDPQLFMQIIRQAFGEIPFIAIIEAGHYRSSPHLNSPPVLGKDLKLRRSDMVSWHVHLITWGYSQDEVRAKLKPFRKRHADMMGKDCGHVVGIEPNEAAFKMLYASKGQVKSYRHYLSGDLDIDRETGKITKRVRQSKGWMRTGDHVKMVEVFGRRRIDQLVFGNGAGTQVANAIRYKAMLPFCKWAKLEIDYDRADGSEFPFVIAYRDLGTRLRREHGEDILSDEPFRLPRRVSRPNAAPAKNRLKRF